MILIGKVDEVIWEEVKDTGTASAQGDMVCYDWSVGPVGRSDRL